MSTRPANVTKAKIARCFAAAAQAGVRVVLEVLEDGTIRMTPVELREAQPTAKRQLAIPKGFYL